MNKATFINQYRMSLAATLATLGLSTVLVGCNTMEGVGTDVKEAGKALERSAERNKESCPRCPYCYPPQR